ncbi:MAG: hypothetical protein ABEI27_07610 [Halobellus sp.]|uniref:hypothetical protein n=1 Tax=Halobellus sp. TaxID=1979212 RepID=UPI0035D4C456
MALRLGQAFGNGIRRVLSRSGGILFVVFLLIQFSIQATVNTAVLGVMPAGMAARAGQMLGLTLPVSGSVAGILFFATMVLSSAFFVVLARALARPLDELSTFPSDLYSRRMGRATVSTIGGGLIVGVAVSVGLALLILPGIYLGAALLFFLFEVGVEDERAFAAIKRSWSQTKGSRLKLSVIVLFSGIVGALVGTVGTVFDLVGSVVLGEIVVNVLNTTLFILLYGIMADAYVQLSSDDSGGLGGTSDSSPVDGGVATE